VKCDPISGPADWGEGLRGEACQLLLARVVDGEDCQLLEEVVGSQGGGKEGGGRERGEVDTGMLCASPHLPARAGESGPESGPLHPFRFLCLGITAGGREEVCGKTGSIVG